MNLQFGCVQRLLIWIWLNAAFICLILNQGIQITDGKVCVKREEIGERPGNLYKCEDLVLTECCEKNRTFTCCELYWKHAMTDQLWLLVAVVIAAVLMLVVVSWCFGQSEFFKSPTAKVAANSFKDKFLHRFDALRGQKNDKIGTELKPKANYITMDSSSQPMGQQQDLA